MKMVIQTTALLMLALSLLGCATLPRIANIPGYIGRWEREAIKDFLYLEKTFGLDCPDLNNIVLIELTADDLRGDSENVYMFPQEQLYIMFALDDTPIRHRRSIKGGWSYDTPDTISARGYRLHGRAHIAQAENGFPPYHWDYKLFNDKIPGWEASRVRDELLFKTLDERARQ